MKLRMTIGDVDYYLSNENLEIGDKVFPLVSGIIEDGEYFVIQILNPITDNFMHGLRTNEPHTIESLSHSKSKSYEVRTDRGFGPMESYFKIVKTKKLKIVTNKDYSSLKQEV